jgi:hypothetical protein
MRRSSGASCHQVRTVILFSGVFIIFPQPDLSLAALTVDLTLTVDRHLKALDELYLVGSPHYQSTVLKVKVQPKTK